MRTVKICIILAIILMSFHNTATAKEDVGTMIVSPSETLGAKLTGFLGYPPISDFSKSVNGSYNKDAHTPVAFRWLASVFLEINGIQTFESGYRAGLDDNLKLAQGILWMKENAPSMEAKLRDFSYDNIYLGINNLVMLQQWGRDNKDIIEAISPIRALAILLHYYEILTEKEFSELISVDFSPERERSFDKVYELYAIDILVKKLAQGKVIMLIAHADSATVHKIIKRFFEENSNLKYLFI